MKLENQVLNIDQVQELQELGFDVEKYSSMCWIGAEDKYRLTIFDAWCLEKTCLGTIPTLTIVDIMEILPEKIKNQGENIVSYFLNINFQEKNIGYNDIDIEYSIFHNNFHKKENIIDGLFETLKWCIQNKYIVL